MTRIVDLKDHFAGSAFRQYGADLYRFLWRRVARPADVDDLAQEVFMRLLRIDKADRVRKPLSYLYGIAAHVVHEFRIREAQDRVSYDSSAVEQLAQHLIEPSQEDAADRLHLQQQLERALLRLPPGQ